MSSTRSIKRRRELTTDENRNSLEILDDEISEYEEIRLKNIRQRREKLVELGLVGQSLNVVFGSKVSISHPKKSKKSFVTPTNPVRQSARIRKRPVPDPSDLSTTTIQDQREIEDEGFHVPFRDLTLKEAFQNDVKDDDNRTVESQIRDSFEGLNAPENVSLSHDLEIQDEEDVIKVVPDRIFSMDFHPSRLLLSVGGKMGVVALANLETKKTLTFRPHMSPINCTTFDEFNPDSNLITSSYDGTVRMLDLESQCFRLLYRSEDNMLCRYHAQMERNTFLITLESSVGIVDTRTTANLKSKIRVFEEDRSWAKTISYKHNLFVSGNNRGQCLIYDLRNPKHQLHSLQNHLGVVTSAFFHPNSTRRILTTEYKDRVHLFEPRPDHEVIVPSWTISHNNHTGRWLTNFQATWHSKDPDLFLIGSMDRPRRIEIRNSLKEGRLIKNLNGQWLNSVCSIIRAHPSFNVVAGGNASGRIHIFQ